MILGELTSKGFLSFAARGTEKAGSEDLGRAAANSLTTSPTFSRDFLQTSAPAAAAKVEATPLVKAIETADPLHPGMDTEGFPMGTFTPHSVVQPVQSSGGLLDTIKGLWGLGKIFAHGE